jgi:hypothetical protein
VDYLEPVCDGAIKTMTAAEQIREARYTFILADRRCFRSRDCVPSVKRILNQDRVVAMDGWIEAVKRWKREHKQNEPPIAERPI